MGTDVSEEAELFSLARIAGAGGLDAVGTDVSGDVTLDDAEANELEHGVDMGGGRGGGGDDSESEGEEEDYVSKLDQQLEEMYAEYKTRTQRRASAALRVEEEGEGGGRSKAQKRKAMREAEAAEAADPEALAQQVAARELRQEADSAELRDRDSDDESEQGEMRNPLLKDLAPRRARAIRAEAGADGALVLGRAL